MTEIHGCWVLTGNEFQTLGAETEEHEIQMLSCDSGLKAHENWMSAETSWCCKRSEGFVCQFVLDFRYVSLFRNEGGGGRKYRSKIRTFDPIKIRGGMRKCESFLRDRALSNWELLTGRRSTPGRLQSGWRKSAAAKQKALDIPYVGRPTLIRR